AQHTEHLARLRARLIEPPAGHPAPSPSATPPPGAPGVPASPAAALTFLRDAERAAAHSLMSRLHLASPSFAQLLASIAASEATHALLLGSHRRGWLAPPPPPPPRRG